MNEDRNSLLSQTSSIVVAAIAAGTVRSSGDITALIGGVYVALESAGASQGVPVTETVEHVGAVSPRKSLADPAHIISMIDGKPYKTLRRHLTTHGMTPEQYRERYNLKADYPMVAPNYSESRRAMAKKIGLGTKANRNA
jgi:predicted transcriptional regulator